MAVVLAMAMALGLGQAPGQASYHHAVGLLSYLAGDYPDALEENDADELKEQQTLADEVVHALEQAGPGASAYVEPAREVSTGIATRAPAPEVSARCRALAERIRNEQHLLLWPTRAPSLAEGQSLWTGRCQRCHGERGDGRGPASAGLKPPPADFQSEKVMEGLTPYQAFNTLGYGVTGTAMVAFPDLTDEKRWALAFFVFTHREPACDHPPPRATLEELSTSTDAELSARYGPNELACLRRRLPEQTPAGALAQARQDVAKAASLERAGDADGARRALTEAYLTGVEPVEPRLKLHQPQLLARIEAGFSRTRDAAGTPGFDAEVRALDALLALAAQPGSAADFWSVLVAAFFILLREGFEAMVVVGALLAVLKKLVREGRPEAARGLKAVHLGWVLALALGALGFVLGHEALAAANREWMETVVSFVAVGLLLYAALWLNARRNISRYMGELRGKLSTAFGQGSLLGLFTISFTAVGRESFETAVFLQGLAVDSLPGTVWGAGLGLAAMLGFVLLVRRIGFALPMKTLFNASTVLLIGTALMLLGKGMHGLEELGVLSQRPLPFFSLEALGVFPDRWTLLPQLVLLLAVLAVWRGTPRRGAMG